MNEIAINTPNIIKGVREYKFSTSNYSDSVPYVFVSSYIEMTAGKTYTVGIRCKEVDEGQCVWGRLNGTTHGKVTFGLFKDKAFSVYTVETGDGAMYHTDGITSVVKTYYNGMMCLTITPSVSGKYYLRIDLTSISSESKPWTRNLYDFTAVEGSTINIIAPITAQAEHTQELMKSDEIKLSWSDTARYDLPMGSNITVNGKTYYLYEPHTPITTDGYEWKYTPNFQSEIIRLGKTPFMLYTLENDVVKSVESDWNFTGDKEAIKIALEDAILRGTGLSYTVEIDEAIDKALIIPFSDVDIITALNNICKDWECEWWYDNNVITITKRYVVGDVIAVTDGVEVQGTTTKTQNTFYNRFYVFGSDRNIPQDYNGAQATQVVNKRLTLDPAKHSGGYIDLPKFDSEGNVLVDANGDYITDESVSSGMIFSKIIRIEEVYPKSDLSVQSICTRTKYMRDDNDNIVYLDDNKTTPDTYKVYYITLIDGVGDLFTINPSTYDKDKNPNGSLIKGKELSLHVKSGALSGREFKLIYHEQSETLRGDDGVPVTIPAHCFEVVFIQDNTVVVPNTNITPKVGDKAIIFNIRMSQMYIDSAYRELEEKALLAIYEESRDKNAYTVKSNQVYFAENNPRFVIGSNILYTVGGRDLVTRVTKLVTKLDRAFEQTITFCKELSKGSISTIIEAIESTEKHVTEVSVKDDRAVQEATRKAYKAQQELKDTIFDTDGYFNGGKIRPETIETLMLSVGAMSTNFALQNVLFEANYGINANAFNVLSNSGKLIHYAIDPDNIKTWNVSASTRTDLVSATAYYVYAQCAVSGTACDIVLSTEQYKYNALVDSNNVYMFLVGTLSSVMSGDDKSYRILSLTYGATTINGGQLKTGRISSIDGKTYFDLDTGVISGQISFKGTSDYTELLGDIADVGSVANSAQTTANTANKNANTANENANKAITTAEQVKDLTITAVDVEYAQNQSTTTAPTSGWSTNAPAWKSGYYIWQRTATTYGAGTTEYSTPTCISGRNGVDGTNGTNGKDGATGAKGDTGIGVKSIVEQYYLSTSSATQSGGSWNTDQPTWASGKYIWTRSVVTYDNGDVDTTTPVLAKAINGANSTANTANNTANTAQATANTANTTANNAKTTADSANSKVDNLQIGGRNYLLGTSIVSSNTITSSSYGSIMYYLSPEITQKGIPSGTTLTLSFERTNTNINGWLTLETPYTTIKASYRASTDGEWVKEVIIFTLTNGFTPTNDKPFIAFGSNTNGATITFRNVKLELGNKATDWTPAPEDVEEEIKAVQAQADAMAYLTNAMKQGSTDINGGLVLTNVVQLKDSGDDVVAGVSGSDNVRFWSGGTLADAINGIANFIVNSEGVLKAIGAILNNALITSGDGTNDIDISGGSISLKRNGTLLTQILAQTLGATIDAGLGKFVSNLGTPSTAQVDILLSGSTNTMAFDYTGVAGGLGTNSIQIGLSGSGEKTIFTASAEGTLTFKANISVTTTIQIPSYTCTRSDPAQTPITPSSVSWGNSPTTNITVSILDNYNNVVFSGSPTAVSGKSFNVVSGRTYRMRVRCNYTNYLSAYCAKPSNLDLNNEGEWFLLTPSWNKTTIQKITVPAVSFNGVATAYNNKIFYDGLIMSADADSYVAIAPKSTADIFRMRHGSAIYKLLANTGLVYNLNQGSSYYLANPIVLSFRVSYSSTTGKYDVSGAYNPKGLILYFSGGGTALVVTHDYGKVFNVSVIVHASRSYATLQAETTTSFTLNLGGNYDATITCIDPTAY